VKYLDILRGGKEGLQQAVNENLNKEERAHTLKANRYKAYNCLCRVIISFFGNQSIDELTEGEWMQSKQELWKWVRSLSIGETRHTLRILAQYEYHVATHDLDFGGDRYGVNL